MATIPNTSGGIGAIRARLFAATEVLAQTAMLSIDDLRVVESDLARAQELLTVQMNGLRVAPAGRAGAPRT